MEHKPEVGVVDAKPLPVAAVTAYSSWRDVPSTIARLLPEMEQLIAEADLPRIGLNVCIYRYPTLDGVEIEVGKMLPAPYAQRETSDLRAASTPTGRAVTAIHFGDYGYLQRTHQRIEDWAHEHGYAAGSVRWEVYGHWSDVAQGRRTDVFWLIDD